MENYFSYYQRFQKNRCNYFQCSKIMLASYDDSYYNDNCLYLQLFMIIINIIKYCLSSLASTLEEAEKCASKN